MSQVNLSFLKDFGKKLITHLKHQEPTVPILVSSLGLSSRELKKFIKHTQDLIREAHEQQGGMQGTGLFSKVKKVGKSLNKHLKEVSGSVGHETMQFLDGKKKIKPSEVLAWTGTALKIASMVPSPVSAELGMASQAAAVGATGAKMAGRGVGKKCNCECSCQKSRSRSSVSGSGGQYAAGLSLSGGALKLAGSGVGVKKKRRGSRLEVWHGIAHMTSGGLVKSDLAESRGKIVSRKRQALGRKRMSR
jgi:hypothetical protein